MVWNKTNKELESNIVEALKNNQLAKDIMETFKVSYSVINRLMTQHLTPEQIKVRYSLSCRVGKLGNKNHMYGKKGELHHNHTKEDCFCNGYKTCFAPDWWSGKKVRSGRVYLHHYVWASFYKQTSIPKGCVIHHIDCNKFNNDITNLQLLTISEHMQLHGQIRKVQRLSREGVENSVLEAHGIL